EDAVVDVRDVHDVGDAVACDLQVPPQQVIEKKCAQVADVGEVPHGRATCVHAHVGVLERFEDVLRPGERVVQAQRHVSSMSATACAAMPSPAPRAPMPSGDVALTLTAPKSSPRPCAMLRVISPRCGPSLGACATTV